MSANTLRIGSWNIGQSLNTKLQLILSQAIQLDLHILALQEIGEAVGYQQQVSAAGYNMYVCTHKYAGVALLVQKRMCPLIREVHKREDDGRLIGIEVQMQKETILVMSAYIHTGIDFLADGDETMRCAQQVYDSICRWSVRGTRVILMGDMNETVSDIDRSYNCNTVQHARLISQLSTSRLVDVYRVLHPHAAGYTHFVTTAIRESRARLDYIFARGWSVPSMHYCRISAAHPISHHRLIHTQLEVTNSIAVVGKRVKVQVPNLRHATMERKEALVATVEEELEHTHAWIRMKAAGNRMDVDELTKHLSSTVYSAARNTLGMTGGHKWRHKSTDRLDRQRRSLTSLLNLAQQIQSHIDTNLTFNCRHWRVAYDKCNRMLSVQLTHPKVDYNQFEIDCRQAICDIRKQIKLAKVRLAASKAEDFDSNTTATVHRMMRQDTPTELTSIVDSAGQLVTDSTRMKQILRDGFAAVFDLPASAAPADIADTKLSNSNDMAAAAGITPLNAPVWYDSVYKQRRNTIQDKWYDSLMAPVQELEVREVTSSCPYYAAPGHDGVSAGVWRVLAENSELVCHVLALLMSACLRLRMMPELGKKSIIVPIPKKRNQKMDMNNIRPISLQAALTKLLSKLLATRLANILVAHPILHPAQEAFIKNGAISNCVDTWLDVWEMSKSHSAKGQKSDCFNLFYDIKAAYDSVQHMDLLRSLHRLRIPRSFIALVADSLCDLSSCVRTIYGITTEFPVRRSVRQGDPLAPLLYVIFMDALHAGMECNPLSQYLGSRDGIRIGQDVVASKGFADDTTAMSGTLNGLNRINRWVHAWIAFNHCQLHPTKTKLVGRHRNKCMVNSAHLTVADVVLTPVSLDTPMSYLGVSVSMNMDWSESAKRIKSMIGLFTSRILAHKLTLQQAVIVINTYLIPKLDLLLRYVNVTCKAVEEWDILISRCIMRCTRLSRAVRGAALSVLTGVILPSQHETLAKISECFIRLNNNTLSSRTGRLRWMQAGDTSTVRWPHSTTNRFVRVKWLANQVGWDLCVVPKGTAWRLCDLVPSGVTLQHAIFGLTKRSLVFDYVGEWGHKLSHQSVTVYTDGSSSSASSDTAGSSWGICFADDWFRLKYASLPREERQITMSQHLRSACVAGAKIDGNVSTGIFMAELQAIYRAVQAVPITYDVRVITDSQAAMKAIEAYRVAISNRKRLRMTGRPLLHLIMKLTSAHEDKGSRVTIQHIKSHTTSATRTIHQAGNSCADRVACHHRIHSTATAGALKELPLRLGEEWVYVKEGDTLITSDIRGVLRGRLRACAVVSWHSLSKHNLFACGEVKELCRRIVTIGSRERVRCVLALLSDSIQYYSARVDRTDSFGELECRVCSLHVIADVKHVLCCSGRASARALVCTAIRAELSSLPAVLTWIGSNAEYVVDLQSFMCILFDVLVDADNSMCWRLMVGAFSDTEASGAMRRMGQSGRAQWQPVMQNVQILLFEYVFATWSELRS